MREAVTPERDVDMDRILLGFFGTTAVLSAAGAAYSYTHNDMGSFVASSMLMLLSSGIFTYVGLTDEERLSWDCDENLRLTANISRLENDITQLQALNPQGGLRLGQAEGVDNTWVGAVGQQVVRDIGPAVPEGHGV